MGLYTNQLGIAAEDVSAVSVHVENEDEEE